MRTVKIEGGKWNIWFFIFFVGGSNYGTADEIKTFAT